MSKLLLDEQPLLVMPKLAEKIGLNEAIILQQIHYWNEINRKANNNFRDGHYWTFNSYTDWQEQFPFWSVPTIKRIIASLEKRGLIVKGNYNKLKIDRTIWYRIDYKVLEALNNPPKYQNDTTRVSKWNDESINLIRPLPETNTETNTESIYTFLSKGECTFLDIYLNLFSYYMGKDHMRVTAQDKEYIISCLKELEECGVSSDDFVIKVVSHLENLPKSNNGNILAFLKASMRYFEYEFIAEDKYTYL